jgi:flagellar motility protein MotE (MotC chaperone)
MQGKLGEIKEKTENFRLVLQHSFPVRLWTRRTDLSKVAHEINMTSQLSSIRDKAWRSRIGKKLKFSFSESQLEKTLEDLKNLNQDFRTLATQKNKLKDARQLPISSPNSPPQTDKAVKDCRASL